MPAASAEDQVPQQPDNFYSKDFLLAHIESILRFYDGRTIDQAGGFYQNYYDDGTHFDPGFKQLVSSTRMVINFALTGHLLGRSDLLQVARHGLDFVETVHWREDGQVYAFTVRDGSCEDMTQQSYAYAFILYMYAACMLSGIHDNGAKVGKVFDLLEHRFWQPDHGAYADTLSADGVLSSYRGQNSNMHICEALIVAHEATKEPRYLARAQLLAETFTQRLAKQAEGLIWEHYDAAFVVDWDYNKDDPTNLYRPWGFQPGHQIEWAKNLLNICRFAPQEWMFKRAKDLFDRSWEAAWDEEHGGLVYGFGPDGKWCDGDKYFWVQAESIATAAQLYQKLNDPVYLERYTALWRYCWVHFVDHKYGAWWRRLSRDNVKYSNEKSLAGAKCDYHTIVSCIEALRGLA